MPARTITKPTHKPVTKRPVARRGQHPPKRQPTKPLAPPTIAVVLDETGSMLVVKAATISSYNEYVRNLRADKNNAGSRFALTRFNTARTATEGPVDLGVAPLLTDASYQPASMTDLYDAIGKTIMRLDAEAPSGPVIVVILTDGEENSSKEYTREAIQKLITEREATGRWTFVYLGANQNAWQVGQSIGVKGGNAMTYAGTALGTMVAMRSAAAATSGITGTYHRSRGTVTGSATAFGDAGIDKCLGCGGKLILGQLHVCYSGSAR